MAWTARALYVADQYNSAVRRIGGVAPLSFGNTYVGAGATAQDITLANNGNTALTFTALSLPTDYNLSGADTTCTATTSLAPGASCILGVVFAPASAGAKSETLTIIDNQGTQTIPVSGTGLALIATSTTFTAGTQSPVEGQSVTLTATVSPAPAGSPVGTVSFYSGTTLLGTVTPDGSGVATLATTGLLYGMDMVTAVYSGNIGFTGSTSAAAVLNVTLPLGAVGGRPRRRTFRLQRSRPSRRPTRLPLPSPRPVRRSLALAYPPHRAECRSTPLPATTAR